MPKKKHDMLSFQCDLSHFKCDPIDTMAEIPQFNRVECSFRHRVCLYSCPRFHVHAPGNTIRFNTFDGIQILTLRCKAKQLMWTLTPGGEFVKRRIAVICGKNGRVCLRKCKHAFRSLSYFMK